MENINYNEIDAEMRGLIKALNEKGYKTKFCCVGFGHDRKPYPYIIFDDNMTDKQAMELFSRIKSANTLAPIDLLKWIRANGEDVLVNWKLEFGDFNSVAYGKRVKIGAYNIILNDINLIEKELLK